MARSRGAVAKSRGRTWCQDPQGRRSRILDAAAGEFAEHGFRLARLGRIAAAAGVAEGTIYHQFGSKQGLLVAMGERYGEGLARAAFGDLGADPMPDEVARIVRNIFAFVRKTDGSLAAFLLSHDPLEGGAAQDANRTAMIAAIVARLELWVEHGLVEPMDNPIAAEVLFGLVESALRDCFLRRRGAGRERYVREVTRCLEACVALQRDRVGTPAVRGG
ncbi:MAG: TetR/AcrR family transcriptional regulator [bacterium]|nr:TetR/AcrR family transcriptional regulator [bacterium]